MARKRSEQPRVVGFDFGPAAPAEAEAAAPPAEPPAAFAAPAEAEVAPAYAPPAYGPPVATVPLPPPQAGYGYPPPPAWMPPPPAKKGTRVKVVVLSVTAVCVGLAVVGTIADSTARTMPGGKKIPAKVTLHTPQRVGGAERMTSAFAKQVEAEALDGTFSLQQPQVALYGNESVPRYFLFAGFSPEQTGKEVYAEFSKGFAGEEEATVGKPKAMAGGVVCGPVSISGLRGAACAWASDRSNGVLVDYQKRDVPRLAKLAAQARAEVNGK